MCRGFAPDTIRASADLIASAPARYREASSRSAEHCAQVPCHAVPALGLTFPNEILLQVAEVVQ